MFRKRTTRQKIVYFARLYIVIDQQGKKLNKELFFELEKLQNWLYSMYSIGIDRKKSVKLEIEDNVIIKITIVDGQNAKLNILNKSEGTDFEIVSTLEDFRNFQSSWKRAISIL